MAEKNSRGEGASCAGWYSSGLGQKNGSPRSESLDTMLHCAIIEDFAHVLVPSMAL